MTQPVAFRNPLSAGLHLIPGRCPICNTKQYDGIKSTDADAPYAEGEGITDLCLNIDRDTDGRWTCCHVTCLHWFRDETVNRLAELAREGPAGAGVDEYDKIHEAIRQSISSDHGDEVLIAMLGPGFHIPNPTAEALEQNK